MQFHRFLLFYYLARSAGKNSVPGNAPQLHVVTDDFSGNAQDLGMLDDLFKDLALVQEVPSSSLKLWFCSISTLKLTNIEKINSQFR